MTRREFIGMGSVGLIAAVIAGRFAWTGLTADEPAGDFPFKRSDAQWRAQLGDARYRILRDGGTEKPYSSPLLKEHRKGSFACAGCAVRLFRSDTKYDRKTGWPSFWDVLPGAITERQDLSLGMTRVETLCSNCGGHLGHVFTDGPQPTGLRYCMNGLALRFLVAAGPAAA